MIRTFVVVLCTLAAFILAHPRAAQAQDGCALPPAGPVEPPSNIQVDPLLAPIVDALRARSATFRCQWRRINAAPIIRISVVPSNDLREQSSARARTLLTRYTYGAMRATVELPPAVDITELLPHEFEHVLEQIEGLDLPALARRGDSGVLQVQRGVFETERARSAGRAALQEVYGSMDPAVMAAVRGLKRAFKALAPESAAPPAAAAHKQR